MSALGLLVSASVASADTTTEDFTTQGCSVITPPSPGPGATPYNTVSIQATGAAGGSGNNGDSNAVGQGGYVTGTIVGVSGQLDVCVNVGGGPDPNGTGGYNGGGGGGASGVSLGGDFSTPVLIAGGGGGAGAYEASGNPPREPGAGGNAGYPSGANGGVSYVNTDYLQSCAGGGGSQTQGGSGCQGSGGGGAPSSSGPGQGGTGNGYASAGGGGATMAAARECGAGVAAGRTCAPTGRPQPGT